MPDQGLIQQYVPLSPLTTLRIGGPARFFAEAREEDELLAAFSFAEQRGLPLFILGGGSNALFVEGQPLPGPGDEAYVFYRLITPHYFTAMGVPLIAGRVFDSRDSGAGNRVVVVNRTMARRYWPNESALGRRVSPP